MRTLGKKRSEEAVQARRLQVARLRATAPRHLASAALLILVALGLRSLLWAPPQPHPSPVPARADVPAQGFALQFARAYLTYDAERPSARARALAPFVGESLDAGAGFFAPGGIQRVLWADVASDQRALVGGRTITVAAGVSSQRLPVYLAVAVRHDRRHGLSLAGYPSFVGAPVLDSRPPLRSRSPLTDSEVATVAARALRNYLAGSATNLKADLAPDAVVSLPTVELAVRSVESTEWIGQADSGAVLATVLAEGPHGASYTLAYELGIERRERPYVSFIQVIPTGA
jgi:hypothetical protein